MSQISLGLSLPHGFSMAAGIGQHAPVRHKGGPARKTVANKGPCKTDQQVHHEYVADDNVHLLEANFGLKTGDAQFLLIQHDKAHKQE